MRRFEYKDSRSYKFWEIDVEDKTYTVRYGKVGTNGSSSSKSFASPEKAALEAEKKIKSKTGKGYAEVAVAAAPSTPASSGAGASAGSDWSVRADALQAAGDPWGERISVFMEWEAAKGAGKRKWKKRLDELDEAHGAHFYGQALLDLMGDKKHFESVARLKWSHGFIDEIRLRVAYDHKGPDAEDMLAALAVSPAVKYTRRMTLGRIADHSDNFSKCMQMLETGKFENLEYLFVGDISRDETEISWITIGDVGKALRGLPALETLRVRGGGVLMSDCEHAKLRRFEVESGGMPSAGVQGFAAAKLPELSHVSLWLGTSDYGGSTEISDLDALWSSETMPKLSHLGLQNSEMQDDIAAALVKSKILAQLSSVDMSMGTMHAHGVEALIGAADRFAHLKSLNLDDNFITSAHNTALRAAFGANLQMGGQRYPESYDDEEYYYTSVAE